MTDLIRDRLMARRQMARRLGDRSGIPALVLAIVAGCGATTAPDSSASMLVSPSVSAGPASEGMGPLEALQWLPADVEEVAYTDWEGIRDAAGLIGAGAEVRDDLFLELLDQHSAQSWFAGPQRLSHLEAWGFDGANAEWELTATLPRGRLVHVVVLGAEADWDSLIGRFEERDYGAETHGDAVLRSVERDLFIDWQAASDSAMLNAATVDGMRLLVMSDELADVEHVVEALTAAEPALGGTEQVTQAAEHLDGTLSGVLLIGATRCLDIGIAPILPPDIAAEYLRGLVRYDVLSGGYLVTDEETRVRAVMTFTDPADAAADVLARAPLAGAWGDTSGYFSLASAEVSESSVILELDTGGAPAPAIDDLQFGGGYTACL